MRLSLQSISLMVGVLVVAGLAMTGNARATPQIAVVGQALAKQPVVAEKVTYYNRYRWGGGYFRPYKRYGYYPSRKYRYYSPYKRYGYYRKPYYRGYGYGYRRPNFYFRYGW